MHDFGKASQVARLERRFAFVTQLFYAVQVVEHRLVALIAASILIFEDGRRVSRVVRKKQRQIVFQVVQGHRVQPQRCHRDAVVGPEFETCDPAERSDVLVLLADRLSQQIQLNVTGLLRKLLPADVVPFHAVERPQQGGRETSGRSQAGSGGNVRHADDLDVRNAEAHQLQSLPHDRMLHVLRTRDNLHFRVLDDHLREERLMQGNVDVLVDRRGDHKTAVTAVV